MKTLPPDWLAQAFVATNDDYCLKSPYREQVDFVEQDIRLTMPAGEFDLILCRNLVFTYFDIDLQSKILRSLLPKLRSGAALVIGKHEALPLEMDELTQWYRELRIFRRG